MILAVSEQEPERTEVRLVMADGEEYSITRERFKSLGSPPISAFDQPGFMAIAWPGGNGFTWIRRQDVRRIVVPKEPQ
jgi:hypothetical protein